MNQQVISSQVVVKAPTTLDKVPEDVQLAIIKFIQSWKKSEGTAQERAKGKRARDSALRAVAMSCRKLHSVYRPELLSDVTLNVRSLLSFYLGLARNQDSGKLVRSITFTHRDLALTPEQMVQAQKNLLEISKSLQAQGIEIVRADLGSVFECAVDAVFQFLPEIQTLIILQPDFNIPLQSKLSNGTPFPFLTHSLKRLFIPMWEGEQTSLKARNVVWILVFCTGLRSASLSCIFDQNDFKYLAEFSDAFSGLSKVLKLALGAHFSSTPSIERYWDRGVGKQWIGGNKKTEAIFHLLKVTKNLQCLEINSLGSSPNERSIINSSLLSALTNSYHSLKSLRLLGIEFNSDDLEEVKANANFSLFQNLQLVSLDAVMLFLWSRIPGIEFPPALKVLCIPYYNYPILHEDLELARSFKVRSFPRLEKVVVPSEAVLRSGVVSDSDDFKKAWLKERRELEKAEMFTGGKVELRPVEPGESIGESSETDFMSTMAWLSPP